MNKAALLQALRESGDKAVSQLARVPAERFEEGRYENGWNGRQILAHMASIEWTYPRLLELASGAPATPKAEAPKSAATQPAPQAVASGSGTPKILSYNDRQVDKRSGASVSELLAEFKENRARTIAAVDAADDALFTKEVTSAGGAKGPLADVINFVAVQHVLVHLRDITGESA